MSRPVPVVVSAPRPVPASTTDVRPGAEHVSALVPDVERVVSGRPLVSVVVAPSGFLQPPLRRDIDVAVQVVAALEVQVATFMIGHRSVPVDALVGAAAVVAGVLRSVVEFAAVVQASSVAVAASTVESPAAVGAVALPVVAAGVEVRPIVGTDTFGIGFAAPVVEATVGVDVATVAIGGDLAREATIDAVVEPIVAHAAVVAGAVSVPVRIDSVATRIVMAAPGVDVAVVVGASVAGVVSAPAAGWVSIAVTTVPIVSTTAAVSVSPTVSVTAREVAYRDAAVSTTPTVATTQTAITFQPSGMTKSGSTTFLNTNTIVNGFAADTGSYPGSEVVGGTTLLVRGAKAGATVAASVVGDGSSASRQFRASLRLNGTEIASASGSNTSTLSLSAQADVVESDQITLFVQRTSGSGFASVGTGTWVRVT